MTPGSTPLQSPTEDHSPLAEDNSWTVIADCQDKDQSHGLAVSGLIPQSPLHIGENYDAECNAPLTVRRISTMSSGRDSVIGRQRCPDWCSCMCHSLSAWESPWFMRRLMGEIIFEYSQHTRQCSERSCLRSNGYSINLTYFSAVAPNEKIHCCNLPICSS